MSCILIIALLLPNINGIEIYGSENFEDIKEKIVLDETTETKEDIANGVEEAEEKEILQREKELLKNSPDKSNYLIVKYKDYSEREITKSEVIDSLNEFYNYGLGKETIEVIEEFEDLSIDILYFKEGNLDKIRLILEYNLNVLYAQENIAYELYTEEFGNEEKKESIVEAEEESAKKEIIDSIQNKDEISKVRIGIIDTVIEEIDHKAMYFIDKEEISNSTHGNKVYNAIISEASSENIEMIPLVTFNNKEKISYTTDIIKAIQYASKNKINIINMSWGSPKEDSGLFELISKNTDILFVCSVSNVDKGFTYPANYDLPNVISVTAHDAENKILEKAPNNKNIAISALGMLDGDKGTSIAAARATGVAALYWNENLDKTAAAIVEDIKNSSIEIDGIDTLFGVINKEGLLNKIKTKDWLDLESYFEEAWITDKIADIFIQNTYYDTLNEEEKDLILNELGVNEESMTSLCSRGYTMKESITKARVMQQLDISVDEVLLVFQNFKSEKIAQEEVDRYRSYQMDYKVFGFAFFEETGDEDTQSISKKINDGVIADTIFHSFIVSKVTDIPIKELIIEEYNQEKNVVLNDTEVINIDKLNLFSLKYKVDVNRILDYLIEKNMTIEELEHHVDKYVKENKIFIEDPNIRMRAEDSSEPGPAEAAPSPPFAYKRNFSEDINLASGSLRYEQPLFSLPGKAGLDLSVSMVYESTNSLQEVAVYGTVSYRNFLDPIIYNTFWRLNQTHVDIYDNVLTLEDGRSYKIGKKFITDSDISVLSGFPQDVIVVKYARYYPNNFSSTAYVVEHSDGKIQLIDTQGRLLQTIDKFGNRITFDYTNNTIIDSYGRKVALRYDGYTVKFVLPDSSEIKLIKDSDDSAKINSYIDQMGNETSYSYDKHTVIKKGRSEINDGVASSIYRLLTKVQYPNSLTTEYSYNKVECYSTYEEKVLTGFDKYNNPIWRWGTFRLGYDFFRVSNRFDTILGNPIKYNYESYSYSSDKSHMGYMPNISETLYNRDTGLITPYEYNVEVSNSKGQTIYYTFKNGENSYREQNNVNTFQEIKYDGKTYLKKNILITTLEGKPINTEIITYDASGGSSKTFELINMNGNKINKTWPLLAENNANAEYQTVYTYHTPTTSIFNAHFELKQKEYKKDAATRIQEVYNYDDAQKAVTSVIIYENGIEKSKSTMDYDKYGFMTEKHDYIDAFNYISTKFNNDPSGLYSSVTIDGITENFTYDKMGRVISYKDGKGYETKYEYDKLGRQIKLTRPDGKTVITAYNDSANTIQITDELGTEIVYSYDPFGNILSVKDVITDNILSRYEYDTNMRLIKSYDADNTLTTYKYDPMDRLTEKSIPDTNYKETYSYEFGIDGNNSKIITSNTGGVNAPEIKTAKYIDINGNVYQDSIYEDLIERVNKYKYDYKGNQIESLTANDDSKGYTFTNKTQYNHRNLVTKTSPDTGIEYKTEYDMLGRVLIQTDPKGHAVSYTYDDRGNILTEKGPLTTISNAYDNNNNKIQELVTNNAQGEAPTALRTDYSFNNRNLLEQITFYDNGNPKENVKYTYDGVGNIKTSTLSSNSAVTTYTYDHLSRLTEFKDAMDQAEKFEYNQLNLMTKKIDKNGNIINNIYDKSGNLIKTEAITEAGKAKEYMEWTYSGNGFKLTEKNENETGSFVYDAMGRLIKHLNGNVEKSYTYDLAGNRIRAVIENEGNQISDMSYKYDKLNRMTEALNGSAWIAKYTYDKNGNRVGLTYGNGMSTIYDYNSANLVTKLINKKGSEIYSSYEYTYYSDGNQRSKTDHEGLTTTYTYDYLGNLKSETEARSPEIPNVKTYTYDFQNRTQMTVSGLENYVIKYTYDKNDRLLKEVKTEGSKSEISNYTYDRNGNLQTKAMEMIDMSFFENPGLSIELIGSKGLRNFEIYQYDVFNKLLSVINENGATVYTYKTDGLRLSKTANGEKTVHVWDGSNIIADIVDENQVVNTYYRGIGLISSTNDGYYFYNAHGDVVQLSDNIGNITKEYHYDAFGVETNPDENDNNPFRYCGEYIDLETNTYYLRNRYYNPSNGRFTAEDPIRSGINWYTYCNNNPVVFIDPFGLESHYIFYNDKADKSNGNLKDRVDKEYNALIKSGVKKEDIYIKMITSEDMFAEEWAKMDNGDNRIQRVALYLHSSPRGIIINGDTNQSVMVDEFDGQKMTGHLLISELEQKDIYEITLYGCNTAHQDYAYENVAYNLINSQKNVSRVIGWDGSMRWGFFDGKPQLAGSQDYFESWLKDQNNKRKPQGRILYEKVWRLDDPSFPEYARQEILISPYTP